MVLFNESYEGTGFYRERTAGGEIRGICCRRYACGPIIAPGEPYAALSCCRRLDVAAAAARGRVAQSSVAGVTGTWSSSGGDAHAVDADLTRRAGAAAAAAAVVAARSTAAIGCAVDAHAVDADLTRPAGAAAAAAAVIAARAAGTIRGARRRTGTNRRRLFSRRKAGSRLRVCREHQGLDDRRRPFRRDRRRSGRRSGGAERGEEPAARVDIGLFLDLTVGGGCRVVFLVHFPSSSRCVVVLGSATGGGSDRRGVFIEPCVWSTSRQPEDDAAFPGRLSFVIR